MNDLQNGHRPPAGAERALAHRRPPQSRDTLVRIFEHHAAQASAALDQKPSDTLRQARLAEDVAQELARRQHPLSPEFLAHLHWTRGAACYSLQRYASAHGWYGRALALYSLGPAAPSQQELQSTVLLNLAFSAEQLHRLPEALHYAQQSLALASPSNRGPSVERVAWLHLMLGNLEPARAVLSGLVADASVELSEYLARVFLVAFRTHPTRRALDRLRTCPAVAHSRSLTAQLAVVLNRSGRVRQAAALLHNSPELQDCLTARLAPRTPGPMVLHPMLASTPVNTLRVRPILAGSSTAGHLERFAAALAELAHFHRRQFGDGCSVTVDPIRHVDPEFAVHQLYDGVDVDSYLRRLCGLPKKPGEIVIVGVGQQSGSGPLGFTSGTLCVLGLPRLLYSESLLVHEFYHAALELEHTDGEADVDDPLSVMAPLECLSYVSQAQRQACLAPADAHRLARRGEKWLAQGEARKALDCFERALEKDAGQRWVYLKLAEAWSWLGDMDQVTSVLQAAEGRFGGVWARLALCQHLAAAGQFSSVRTLQDGLKSWQKAHVYFECGHFQTARRWYQADKARGYAADGVAWCLMASGQWDKAEEALQMLLRTSPWSWTLHARMAEIHAFRGDAAAARHALRQARQRIDDPTRLGWHRLSVYRLLGQWTSAVAWLKRNTHQAGVPTGPWLELGYACWQAGDAKGALLAFETAILCHPPLHGETRLAAAWVSFLHKARHPQRALEVERLAKRLPYSIPALHLWYAVSKSPLARLRLRALCPRSQRRV